MTPDTLTDDELTQRVELALSNVGYARHVAEQWRCCCQIFSPRSPSARGCLLHLVRDAHDLDDLAAVRLDHDGDDRRGWHMAQGFDPWHGDHGDVYASEDLCLIEALESAP